MDEPTQGEVVECAIQELKADAPGGGDLKKESIETFSTFYREYISSLIAFLIYQGAQLADASEIAQEAMALAFRSWVSIKHPKAWTRRVASRALVRRIASSEDLQEEPLPSAVLLPDRNIANWEEEHEIVRLMRLLPLRQRQVLAWYLDGYQPIEIATELDLTPTAVRVSLMKARRAIARQMTDREVNAE